MKLRSKKDPWRRCWRGNLPRRRRILIYDSNERLSMINSERDRCFDWWLEKTGGRIKFYMEIEPLPFETLQLWDPAELQAA